MRQKEDSAGVGRTCMTQVVENGIADRCFKWINVPSATLGPLEVYRRLPPVDIVEPQPAEFSGTNTIDREEQKNCPRSKLRWLSALGPGNDEGNLLPGRTDRNAFISVDPPCHYCLPDPPAHVALHLAIAQPGAQ